jgi:hypothetical protein
MCSSRVFFLLLLAGTAAAADDGFLVGGGVESDTADGLRVSALGGLGLGEATWLSGGISKSTVELPIRRDINTLYGDLELDHWFDPVGVRFGVSYWGDSDILDSNDWRAALYWRNDKVTLSADYEFRDFDFTVPSTDFTPGRDFTFDADGIGLRARFQLSDNVSMSLDGKKYDYSVDLVPDENRDVISLISVSRLSLINSLIDSRAGLEFAIDRGLTRWEFDFSTWKGEIDSSRTNSLTVRYLVPAGGSTDIEFGLGYDDSDDYGDVTFLSLFLYFYGD